MNVQNISLNDIHPYAKNPRKNDEAVSAVAASIREFGFLVPLVIDRNHEIVAGHTRYRAAKQLGMKDVPCVIADELTEDQIKAFRLADNKVGELASWDMDLLPLELADIMLPMTDFGFEAISEDEFGESFTLDDGEKKPFQQISITVHDEQAKLILAAIKYVYDHKAVTETFTNENHNGNGLYEVVRGKVVNNSKLHFGVFLDGTLHGVMSYGPSLDKSKIIGLVEGTGWNEFLELNRMAFDSVLPRNSESRAISMSIKLIRKYAPQVKWIISFADACSCGDGTIYRASNFVLTGIKENLNLAALPDGTRVHKMTLASNPTTPRRELGGLTFFDVTGGTYNFKKYLDYVGARPIPGFQLRYMYFIDPKCRKRLTVPEIPFSRIDELGAGMYKGEKVISKLNPASLIEE